MKIENERFSVACLRCRHNLKFRDSTLSSVYVTTESHEKRMRVAEQCALRFADSITL